MVDIHLFEISAFEHFSVSRIKIGYETSELLDKFLILKGIKQGLGNSQRIGRQMRFYKKRFKFWLCVDYPPSLKFNIK